MHGGLVGAAWTGAGRDCMVGWGDGMGCMVEWREGLDGWVEGWLGRWIVCMVEWMDGLGGRMDCMDPWWLRCMDEWVDGVQVGAQIDGHKMITVDDKMITVDKIITVDHKMITVDDKMITVDDKMITVDHKMITVDDKMITVDDKMITVDDKIITVDHKMITVDDKTITVDNKTITVDDKMITVDCVSRERFGFEHPKYSDALLDYGFFLLNVDAITSAVHVYQVSVCMGQSSHCPPADPALCRWKGAGGGTTFSKTSCCEDVMSVILSVWCSRGSSAIMIVIMYCFMCIFFPHWSI